MSTPDHLPRASNGPEASTGPMTPPAAAPTAPTVAGPHAAPWEAQERAAFAAGSAPGGPGTDAPGWTVTAEPVQGGRRFGWWTLAGGVTAALAVVGLVSVALVPRPPGPGPELPTPSTIEPSAPSAPNPGSTPESTPTESPVVAPSDVVLALADAAHLSEEGRRLFYAADPQVLDAAEFQGRCELDDGAASEGTAVGCFRRGSGRSSIVLYRPADERLHGFLVEAAAHETLHAAWVELAPHERDHLAALLEEVVAGLPADAPIHGQIAGSVGQRPQNRPTELFAYVGTQVWAGGLHPDLEAAWARYVDDRAALVAVHTSWRSLLEGMDAEIRTRSDALVAQQSAVAQRRAQHDADTATVAHYRATYEQKRAEVDAMPPEQRAGLQLGWAWWDGTELPMQPAEDLLATVAGLLARDEAALATRATELAADEATVAQERVSVEAGIADLQMLHGQLDPGGPSR